MSQDLVDSSPITISLAVLSALRGFDESAGILACEAGVLLSEILALVVPKGWFLPVTPGTKFVTIGGAIANDVHGKNHHRAGTFGCHVRRFELCRSDGERLICSPTENPDWFAATIGGIGLTGDPGTLLLTAEADFYVSKNLAVGPATQIGVSDDDTIFGRGEDDTVFGGLRDDLILGGFARDRDIACPYCFIY